MFERFTERARRAVVLAQEEARALNHDHIGTDHILLGLIHEGEGIAARALVSLGISLEAVRHQVEQMAGPDQQAPSGHIPFTPRAKKALEFSLPEALQLGHNHIGTEHILLGLLREDKNTSTKVLVRMGIDLNRLRQRVLELIRLFPGPDAAVGSETIPATPTVDEFGRNLTAAMREETLDPVVGREKEIERIMQVLSRRTKNSPVLVGGPGVGKTAVVTGLAQKIVKGDVPSTFVGRQLYALDLAAAAAASGSQAEYRALLKKILGELKTSSQALVFIDNLPGLLAADAAIDATSFLKPLLASGKLQIISAATPDGYHRHLETDAVFEAAFQPVSVAEPTAEETIAILKGLRDRYEAHHRVTIENDALVAAAELAASNLPGKPLLGKAIDLIDEAASMLRMRLSSPPDLHELDEKIADARRLKEEGIDSQDFEKAAAFRDTEKQLLAQRAAREREWQTNGPDILASVTPDLVAETLAIMSGMTSEGRTDGQHSGRVPAPPFSAVGLPDADPEIWAMS